MRLQGREEGTIITSAVVLAARLKPLWFEKEAPSGLLSSNAKICNLLHILKISNAFYERYHAGTSLDIRDNRKFNFNGTFFHLLP